MAADAGLFGHVPAEDPGGLTAVTPLADEAATGHVAIDDDELGSARRGAVDLDPGVILVGPEVGQRCIGPTGAQNVVGDRGGLLGGVGAVSQPDPVVVTQW